MRKVFTIIILICMIASFAWSKNIYVATGGDDEKGDGSPDNPYKTIQKGIDVAKDGDTVLIADKDLDFKGKAIDVTWEKLSLDDTKNSFFIISAIKTVSGKSPEGEFFDINLKLQYSDYKPICKRIPKKISIFSLVGIDVALSKSDGEPSESNSEPSENRALRDLSEAGLSLNVGFTGYHRDSRQIFGELQLKAFDTIPYWGCHLGSIELNASDFFTSYMTFGYLHRFFKMDYSSEYAS